MAKDILKEAIADAKAVREVALANAKAALEEAFTPKLQSMLSAKLSEDLDEAEDMEEMDYGMEETMYDEEKEMEETYMDEADVEEAEMEEITGMENEAKDMEENLDEEIDLEEILSELELEEEVSEEKKEVEEAKKDDEDDVKKEAKDDKEMEEEKLDEMGRPIYKAEEANDPTYKAEYVNEDESFDLDALLEEINNLDEEEDKNEAKDMEETMDEVADVGGLAEIITLILTTLGVGMAGFKAAGGKEGLKKAIADAGGNKMKGVSNFLGMTGAGKGVRTDLEETEVSEELEETKAALETVRAELNEVNLLNSKLLYVNRIFKANNLDEAQKLRVVETLDNASNVKEAKLIYETIKDTFTVANAKKASFKSKTKSIKEGLGMASKAAGTSTAPKNEVITESTNMVNRFQKLANIKIN